MERLNFAVYKMINLMYNSHLKNDIEWIEQSGMVNANFFIEDGLSNEDGIATKDNNWSYNQGLFIGAYVRWYNLSKDNAFLETAPPK